ncbi:hypothetical protein GALMADRAFT_159893 [Galerina marginata CBS 339.88]|uniref:DUF6699 domain-containing protein n=1 Tax=Galerina marginata (strain CBS 339.88) TaxID=685588 RepID=A0A067SK76_GALM3|nr:hypothetical protein GALMADRAFT_159893 [Galerina marginata CBS 339.88]
MYMHAHDLSVPVPSLKKVVRFKDGDEMISYGELSGSPSPLSINGSLPTSSPPISTPSPTTSDTTDEYSDGPSTPPTSYIQDFGDRPVMSHELVQLQAQRWTFGKDGIAPQWDYIPATRNPVIRIYLYIEGLPIRIVVEPPSNMETISIGHLYRTIQNSLHQTVSPNDPNSDLNLLDREKKARVLEYFARRRGHTGATRMQKFDFLLGRHVLTGITPCHGGKSWRLVFRGGE